MSWRARLTAAGCVHYSLQNTTGATLAGALTLLDGSGTALATLPSRSPPDGRPARTRCRSASRSPM